MIKYHPSLHGRSNSGVAVALGFLISNSHPHGHVHLSPLAIGARTESLTSLSPVLSGLGLCSPILYLVPAILPDFQPKSIQPAGLVLPFMEVYSLVGELVSIGDEVTPEFCEAQMFSARCLAG